MTAIQVENSGKQQDSVTREVATPVAPTPLPDVMRPVFVVLATEGVYSTVLAPFVGYYCAHLRGTSIAEAGFVSGVLVSAFMLGQIISSRYWGAWSDQFGRRPVLLTGLLGCGVATFCFGLAPSFLMAVIVRFAMGLSNGNSATCKTVVAEVCDTSNQARGFGVLGAGYGLGSMFGMAVGGLMYDPHSTPWGRRVPWVRDSAFLAANPAFAPCFVAALFAFASAAYVHATFEETNRRVVAKEAARAAAVATAELRAGVKAAPPPVPTKKAAPLPEDEVELRVVADSTPARRPTEDFKAAEMTPPPPPVIVTTDSAVTGAAAPEPRHDHFGLVQLWRDGACRRAVASYVMTCAHDVVFNEVFPLWAIVPRLRHGLGVTPAVTGMLNITTAVCAIVSTVAFGSAQQLVGRRRLWQLSAAGMAVTILAVPEIIGRAAAIGIRPDGTPGEHSLPLHTLIGPVVVIAMARMGLSTWCYSLSYLAISHNAPRQHLGAINGLAQALGACVRMSLPPLATPMFAWSVEKARPWPTNATFAFLIPTAIAAFAAVYTERVNFSEDPHTQPLEREDPSSPETSVAKATAKKNNLSRVNSVEFLAASIAEQSPPSSDASTTSTPPPSAAPDGERTPRAA